MTMQGKTILCALAVLWGLGVLAGGSLVPIREDEFVLGFYSAEGTGNLEQNFRFQKSIGINYVQTYAAPRKGDAQSVARCRAFVDTAQKVGLKVMCNLNGHKYMDQPDGVEQLVELVREFKDHPAIGMWYMADEPPVKKFPFFTRLTEALHQLTPSIPCTVVEMWITDWWRIKDFCDVVMADYYPVRGEAFPGARLSSYAQFMRGATHLISPKTKKRIPAIAVMQTMDFSAFTSMIKPENRKTLRFPNMSEMRFMGLSPVAYGARGLFFFSYYRAQLERAQNLRWFTNCFVPFLGEVKGFTALVHPAWEVTANAADLEKSHQVIASCWKRKTGTYLMLINNTAEVRDLELPLSAQKDFPKAGKLMPMFQTRDTKTSLQEGTLSVPQMQPWESFIWKVLP